MFKIIELIILFIILPLLYLTDLMGVNKLIPLVGMFGYCIAVLIIQKRMNHLQWKLKAEWKLILIRFALICLVVVLFIKFFTHGNLISGLGENKKFILAVILYPFLSAFPQELIYREFFFYRYKDLFKNSTLLLIANILLFSFAHIYFQNWIVIISTLIGGTIFALTFIKTKSLLVVTIEHTLYGLMILSSGMAEYFYKEL